MISVGIVGLKNGHGIYTIRPPMESPNPFSRAWKKSGPLFQGSEKLAAKVSKAWKNAAFIFQSLEALCGRSQAAPLPTAGQRFGGLCQHSLTAMLQDSIREFAPAASIGLKAQLFRSIQCVEIYRAKPVRMNWI
jgi:hypothetical protein